MTRTNRISYKGAARAKVAGRFKEMIVVFLLAIAGILVSVSINAQTPRKYNRSHRNECRILAKKRTGKMRSSRHNFLWLSKHTTKKETQAEALVSSQITDAATFQLNVIREMVAVHLKEQNDGNPIELAPLELVVTNQKLNATDNNPFLIAVEFGLQGRTIVISNTDITNEIRSMMINMGVPNERISIAASANSDKDFSQQTNRRVEFMAI